MHYVNFAKKYIQSKNGWPSYNGKCYHLLSFRFFGPCIDQDFLFIIKFVAKYNRD